ncbi:MAG: DUF3783 domain-containing protein [Desulfococcaceae bacterium]|jgi:hypothetical protein|nr:DUF3783 domain-containing protein [Desulfococcaceae bacterium]
MKDRDFEEISQADTPLYGPRKLLVCGFPAEVQTKFIQLLEMLEMGDLPIVWSAAEDAERKVGELAELPDKSGMGRSSDLPRAIIVCGITEKELHRLMEGCRMSGMKRPLWAVLTPTSENWTLKEVLKHLQAEREALEKRKE